MGKRLSASVVSEVEEERNPYFEPWSRDGDVVWPVRATDVNPSVFICEAVSSSIIHFKETMNLKLIIPVQLNIW